MSDRHRGRELAFKALFQVDQSGEGVNAVLARFDELGRARPAAAEFAGELARGAAEARSELDALVASAASNWKLERLLSVDRVLLRLGTWELAHAPDVPTEVVLDECIGLARRYGSDDSPAFVNGVLDALARRLRPASPQAAPGAAGEKP